MDENFRPLVGWGAVLGAVTVAVRVLTGRLEPNPRPGVPVFGWLLLFLLLALMAVIPFVRVPSCGIPAWGAALVFLAAAAPMALATVLMGGVGRRRVVVAWLVLAALGAVFTALWYAASLATDCPAAALARYVVASAVLCAGTVVAGSPEMSGKEYGSWWLVAPSPYVILVDAVPRVPASRAARRSARVPGWHRPWDPLEPGKVAIWDARDPAWDDTTDDCYVGPDGRCIDSARPPGPVWPYGLAADAVLAAGAVHLARRRSRMAQP